MIRYLAKPVKRHRIDHIATAKTSVRNGRKVVVTVCKFGIPAYLLESGRYKVTPRWDATTCKVCRRIVQMAPMVEVPQDRDFSPAAPGVYDAELTKADLRQGPKGPYYNAEWTLRGEGVNGKKVWQTLSLSADAFWRFKDTMLKLGADKADLMPGSKIDTDEIIMGQIGGQARLKLGVEEYDANDGTRKERNNVQEVSSSSVTLAYGGG